MITERKEFIKKSLLHENVSRQDIVTTLVISELLELPPDQVFGAVKEARSDIQEVFGNQ